MKIALLVPVTGTVPPTPYGCANCVVKNASKGTPDDDILFAVDAYKRLSRHYFWKKDPE